jgi:hypothetical protein
VCCVCCVCLAPLLQRGGQPVQALVQPVASGSTAGLDVPLPVAQAMQTQLVSHLRGTHGVRKVLLVGEHEQDGFAQLVLVQHAVELVARGVDAVSVVGIYYEYKSLGVLIVVSPKRPDFVL